MDYQDCISLGPSKPERYYKNADINFKCFGNRRKLLYDIINNIDSFSFEKNAMSSPNNMMLHLGHSMHGLALPFAVHLGVKHICVIGWDGHQKNKPHHFDNNKNGYDFSEYGCKAIKECNKVFPKFLKDNFDVDIYQINTESLYTEIPKITMNDFINL